jgi:hypothetical protein
VSDHARFHAEVAAGQRAEINADGIAHEHVQDDVVPPTLVEVGQPVLKRQLHELKADADGPRDARMTEEHGLAPPAEEVAKYEDVERLLQVGPRAGARHPLLVHVALGVQGRVPGSKALNRKGAEEGRAVAQSAVGCVRAFGQGHACNSISAFSN